MANFFYTDSTGTKQGPVSRDQLKNLAAQGIITPQSDLETESGQRGKAGQIAGLFPPLISTTNPFGSRQNLNVQQVSQVADNAYKTFAENATWKTALFRITQLMVVAFEVLFLLYGFFCCMSEPRGYYEAQMLSVAFFQTRLGIALLFCSLIVAAMCIAVLETAISTSKMADYLRRE